MAWLNSGIDFSLPGNGGPDCVDFHTTPRRVFETSVGAGLCLMSFYFGYIGHTVPSSTSKATVTLSSSSLNRLIGILCAAMTIVYVLEVGFKFITLQAIFSVNPCHCLCLVHIFLILAWKYGGGLFSTYVFRIHLFFLHGPFMAVIFPVTNTLFLPGEIAVYWLEHFLLLVIPVTLLRVYTVPKFSLSEWWHWGLMAYGVWGAFHYFFLQPLALWTQANLNSMLCPAITDPFRGPNYKLHAIWHQFAANMASGFFFYIFGIRETPPKPKDEDENRNGFKRNGNGICHEEKIKE